MILITGGLGFIGLHTGSRLRDAGEQVVLKQYRMRREPDFIKSEIGKRAFIETLDVTVGYDVIDVVRRHKVTGIVHLAVPGLGALSSAEDYRVNMMGFLNILEAARLFAVRRVSLASSVAVYASLPEGPFREEALLPVHSGNPTETFKKALEILGLHYASRTNLEVVALRIGSPFGPLYHSLAAPTSRICHAAAKGAPTDFTGVRRGAPYEEDDTGAFYVKDCAAAIQLLQMAEKLSHRIYNIGTEIPTECLHGYHPDQRRSRLPATVRHQAGCRRVHRLAEEPSRIICAAARYYDSSENKRCNSGRHKTVKRNL